MGFSLLPMRWGSPPHMRGKVDPSRGRLKQQGITPAHAGKRLYVPAGNFGLWDHPRTCGEKTQEVTKYKAYDILHA